MSHISVLGKGASVTSTFVRAAFSPVISEALDRSDGIYHRDTGELVAQGELGLPIISHSEIMDLAGKGAMNAGAVARRNEVWLKRLTQVLETCRPDGHLQERHLSLAHYLARYGTSFVDAYWREFELDPRRLQVLHPFPSEGDKT